MTYNADVRIGFLLTKTFIDAADRLLSAEEQDALIDYLSVNPSAGDLIPGTGGVRKLRWSGLGRGKRGGVRVVYYYHSHALPVALLFIYAKSRQDDLGAGAKRRLKDFTRQYAKHARMRKTGTRKK